MHGLCKPWDDFVRNCHVDVALQTGPAQQQTALISSQKSKEDQMRSCPDLNDFAIRTTLMTFSRHVYIAATTSAALKSSLLLDARDTAPMIVFTQL